MPKVSIIIPTYNGATFVAPAIQSAVSQTYKDLEIVINDDCSSDDTVNICKRFAQADSRIVVTVNQTNLGLYANANRALSLAKGDYIKCLWQDDLIAHTAVEEMLELIENDSSVTLVACAENVIDSDGAIVTTRAAMSETSTLEGLPFARAMFLSQENQIGNPSSTLFRQRDIRQGFDASLFAIGDFELWIRLLQSGKLVYVCKPLSSFRRHENQATTLSKDSLSNITDWITVNERYADLVTVNGTNADDWAKAVQESLDHKTEWITSGQRNLTFDQFLSAVRQLAPLSSDHRLEHSRSRLARLAYEYMRRTSILKKELHSVHQDAQAIAEQRDQKRDLLKEAMKENAHLQRKLTAAQDSAHALEAKNQEQLKQLKELTQELNDIGASKWHRLGVWLRNLLLSRFGSKTSQ